MTGHLDIINIGAGHLNITFDGSDPDAVEKARTAITDMLSWGYLIVVKNAKGVERKVAKFDPKKNCYIIKEVGGATEEVPLTEGQATAVDVASGG